MKKITLYGIGLILIIVLGAALFIAVRIAAAAVQAERKWQSTQVDMIQDFGSTSQLEILPLYEEAGDPNRYQIGHGLSYLIKTESATILLDVGNNPTEADATPLSVNMKALDVSWDQIDALFFSHFHPDHVGGVETWKAHEASLGKAALDFQVRPVYIPSSFNVPGTEPTLLMEPTVISSGVASTGAIEYGETFPIALYTGSGAEQSLAVNVEGKGIVLIMGCGHPKVERIVTRAEELFEPPVVGIVGGFHYEHQSAEDVQTHIEFLQARKPLIVAPSPHDSSAEALQTFQSAFAGAYREIQVRTPVLFP